MPPIPSPQISWTAQIPMHTVPLYNDINLIISLWKKFWIIANVECISCVLLCVLCKQPSNVTTMKRSTFFVISHPLFRCFKSHDVTYTLKFEFLYFSFCCCCWQPNNKQSMLSQTPKYRSPHVPIAAWSLEFWVCEWMSTNLYIIGA